ncbi:MAG: hypothetical protein AAGI92_09165 [Pseudomonadota bacterium]
MEILGWVLKLVSSGTIAEIAIVALVLEALWFLRSAKSRRTRAYILFNAGSGVLLMLALRTALIDGPPVLIVAFLSASFLTHIGELKTR